MYEYIKGNLIEINPTYAVVDAHGIGYFINISLNTYSKLSEKKECLLYIHQTIREDAHILYGFFDKKEREIFELLISVSGIGPNTARMMLSSLSSFEIKEAINTNNVTLLKSVKGIGAKSAQRIIIDLKDKLGKFEETGEFLSSQNNTNKDEALSGLVMLGFSKNAVEKVLNKIISENNNLDIEELIKLALKRL
ncbi:MAG: Holliday junction branch migration protein RuvA [Bacteroidetes bacterium]|nr:Holliday junction branch migration protein RuvA [Bacteroidota bacterium]